MEISIFLAEKNDQMRELLVSLLEDQDGVRIAGTSHDAAETERLLSGLNPQMAIVDVHLEGFDAVAAFRRMCNGSPGTKLVALSNHANRQFAKKMLRAGACGYLLKDCALEELSAAVQTVNRNQTYISPSIRG